MKLEKIEEEEAHFYDQLDGLGHCVRYELVGGLLVLVMLDITEPLYIVAHAFMSYVLSMSSGILCSRSASDSNLS